MPKRPSERARRAAIRARASLIRGNITHERRYIRALRGIMAGVHDAFMAYLEPAMKSVTGGQRTDQKTIPPYIAKATGKVTADVDNVLKAVLPQVGPRVAAAHATMVAGVERTYRSSMKGILPVGWERLSSNAKIEAGLARERSIQLVETATRAYAADVRAVFENPENTFGKRWEDLRDLLFERGNVSQSRAELIARDQTIKTSAAINRANQTAVGIDSFIWSTSKDERVRPEHEALDGETFSWVAGDPEEGLPGDAINCRCVAVPLLDLEDMEA